MTITPRHFDIFDPKQPTRRLGGSHLIILLAVSCKTRDPQSLYWRSVAEFYTTISNSSRSMRKQFELGPSKSLLEHKTCAMKQWCPSRMHYSFDSSDFQDCFRQVGLPYIHRLHQRLSPTVTPVGSAKGP